MVLARKQALAFNHATRLSPEPRHRLEAYATLLSGVSSDLWKMPPGGSSVRPQPPRDGVV